MFLGDGGIISEARPGQILVDHSTVGPDTSKAIYAAAAAKGAFFLDAPISGGVERAADGTLTIMAGGDAEAFAQVLPIFEACGTNIRHVGAPGAGSIIKLINQLLCGIHSLAAAEAFLVGTRGGADPQTLLDILSTSWGTSFMLSRNGPVMWRATLNPAEHPCVCT